MLHAIPAGDIGEDKTGLVFTDLATAREHRDLVAKEPLALCVPFGGACRGLLVVLGSSPSYSVPHNIGCRSSLPVPSSPSDRTSTSLIPCTELTSLSATSWRCSWRGAGVDGGAVCLR